MDDDTENLIYFEDEDSCPLLSPIVEMDESSNFDGPAEEQSEDFIGGLGDDLKKRDMFEGKLNLETSVENFEDKLPQPETPPEILRARLNRVQNEFEELKEFTVLERQICHSDCIPRETVNLLEVEFSSLNEKVQHLMDENSEYKRKLQKEENENTKLKSELAKNLSFQNEGIILITRMRQILQEKIEDVPSINENELPPPSFLEKCGESIREISSIPPVEPFLNSLKGLYDWLKILLHDKKVLQDKVNEMQLEGSGLCGTIEKLNEEIAAYEQNLTSVKSSCTILQEKFANVDTELKEISVALSVSQNRLIEAEAKKDSLNSEKFKLKGEMDATQEKIISFINRLESLMCYLNDNSGTNNSLVLHEDPTALENNLTYYHDLQDISRTLAVLEQTFLKLERELKFKHEECYELKLNMKQLNDRLAKCEEDAQERKIEITLLKEEVNKRIPSRLLELQNCLESKGSENLKLKSNVEVACAKIDELSNKLSEAKMKVDEMNVVMHTNSLEKVSLENEILKLKDRLAVEDTQTHIILAIQHLEKLINSWDEKSNLEHFVNFLQGNEDIINITYLLMTDKTRSMFSEVVMKYKAKLLYHDQEKNKVCSMFKKLKNNILQLESENKELRIKVNALDDYVKKEISNRVNDLEKLWCFTDHEKAVHERELHLGSVDNCNDLFMSEENSKKDETNLLKVPNKLQKEINNINKATKLDETVDKFICDLNEIENLVDSFECLEGNQIREFTKHLNEKFLRYCDNQQHSKFKVDVLRIMTKFEMKLIEMVELNNQLLQTVKLMNSHVKDYKNEQEVFKNTIEDLEFKSNILKEQNMSEHNNCEKKHKCDSAEEIKHIKQLMMLEITGLDEVENEEALMCESLEHLFSKLMQIIMKKEQEMSINIEKQQKEEFHNFEHTIEKLNNKLKSQDSWTKALESENDKINIELSALKSLNNSNDYKLKTMSNDINKKTSDIEIMKIKILELTTENDSLTSDLVASKELNNKYKHSISSLEKHIKELKEEIANKSNQINNLELKLTSVDRSNSELNVSHSSTPFPCVRGDAIMPRASQIYDTESNNLFVKDTPYSVKDLKGNLLETGLLAMLREEIDFVNNMLQREGNNVALCELFLRCHEKLDLLKNLIQIIGSKVSELEISRVSELQSIQTTLDYKSKEMHDFKLSISRLYKDLVPDEARISKAEIIDESFQHCSFPSVMKEFNQIKSGCAILIDGAEELEQSAKIGQNIIQRIRNAFRVIVDENDNMTKLVHDLRKSVEYEQEKTDQLKQKADGLSKEKCVLALKNSLLENEIRKLKLELSDIKREIFLEIDICFPDKMQNNEKVGYLNSILKHYSDEQKLYNILVEDLRFFGYQCEMMLSYILSLEYKLCLAAKQKENLEKENTIVKGQLSCVNLQINRFINQLTYKSPFAIKSLNQALEVITHVLSKYKLMKENEVKHVNDAKWKEEKMLQQQKELTSLTNQNSSLKFELAKCEDSIRNLRSELRTVRSKLQRKENVNSDLAGMKQGKVDIAIQTGGTCCKRLLTKITEQKEKIDTLSTKLTRQEQLQRSTVTSNPYNKQVTHLEGALGQAKERIGRLNFELKQEQGYNQELTEALKRHENRQQHLGGGN